MPEYPQNQSQEYGLDINTRLRDLEDRMRLLKDRTLLIGKSLIDSREKNFSELQEAKKAISHLTEENLRLKELTKRMAEQINNSAKKEDLLIIQRQLDLLREN
ncbi:MAG: hypothetical protein Q7R87_00355 [Nanoarchaeota archaeon]|nr:hypothetical protein [Nanoarchaeota archaeon]